MSARLTYAPLPRLPTLARAALSVAEDIAGAAAPWRGGASDGFVFSRSSWALAALAAAAKPEDGRSCVVWLPDYFCDDATHPLRATGATVHHYPITDALTPDWDACANMAKARAPDVFVLVHYFGLPSAVERAQEFCASADALLVEDGAHALGPGTGIGASGSAVFYSPHKVLAVPHGSVLAIGNGNERIRDGVAHWQRKMPHRTPVQAVWALKRIVQALVPDTLTARLSSTGPADFSADGIAGPVPEAPGCGAFSARLLRDASAEMQAVARTRRENWGRIAMAARGFTGWEPLTPAPEDWTPYRMVMRCADAETAARTFAHLRREGLPVESWPDLAQEVRAEPDRHVRALALRRTVLLLPVHQTLDIDKACRIVATLGGAA